MSSTTSHLLYPLVTADTLECLTQPAQETTRGQPKQRLTRSCPFPKQTQAPNKHYSWKFMCRNDKKINLGSIVCQISLLVPIREIDGWSKNCIKCHSAHYLPTFMAFHAHGPISLLLIFFFTSREALTIHCRLFPGWCMKHLHDHKYTLCRAKQRCLVRYCCFMSAPLAQERWHPQAASTAAQLSYSPCYTGIAISLRSIAHKELKVQN